jgi:uncharacterized membrane protein YbjE (DUF340 family)
MGQFASLLVLLCCIAGGMILGKTKAAPPAKFTDAAVRVSLLLLLFSMGFRIGNDGLLRNRLSEIGFSSLAAAVAAVAGTALAYILLSYLPRAFMRRGAARAERAVPENGVKPASAEVRATSPGPAIRNFRGTLILLAVVCAGFAAGIPAPVSLLLIAREATSWTLYLLLFFIGIQLIQSGVNLVRSALKFRTVALPLLTAFGTLAGGLALYATGWLGESPGKTLSLTAGFGWYSLSGVLITDMGSPFLGSIGFLANMFREAISLLLIPLLARAGAPELAIGVAGATSMDVTLPLVEQCCGPEYVPASVVHGALLSLLVPLLVPLFYKLG